MSLSTFLLASSISLLYTLAALAIARLKAEVFDYTKAVERHSISLGWGLNDVQADYVPRSMFYKMRDGLTERVEILEQAIKHAGK